MKKVCDAMERAPYARDRKLVQKFRFNATRRLQRCLQSLNLSLDTKDKREVLEAFRSYWKFRQAEGLEGESVRAFGQRLGLKVDGFLELQEKCAEALRRDLCAAGLRPEWHVCQECGSTEPVSCITLNQKSGAQVSTTVQPMISPLSNEDLLASIAKLRCAGWQSASSTDHFVPAAGPKREASMMWISKISPYCISKCLCKLRGLQLGVIWQPGSKHTFQPLAISSRQTGLLMITVETAQKQEISVSMAMPSPLMLQERRRLEKRNDLGNFREYGDAEPFDAARAAKPGKRDDIEDKDETAISTKRIKPNEDSLNDTDCMKIRVIFSEISFTHPDGNPGGWHYNSREHTTHAQIVNLKDEEKCKRMSTREMLDHVTDKAELFMNSWLHKTLIADGYFYWADNSPEYKMTQQWTLIKLNH